MGLINCPECSNQVSEQAERCPHCGYPIAKSYDQPKQPAQPELPNNQQKPNNFARIAVAVVIALAFVIYAIANSPDNPRRPAASKQEHSDAMAWRMSKDFVTKRLAAPSTAVFPWYHQVNHQIKQNGRVYTIKAYVDAENGFGAQIRQHFTAKVRYDGEDTWSLVDLQFQ